MTEELLQEKFSEFGKISKLTILKDSNGNSKGVAFVNFETPDNAKRAMEEINGTQVGSKIIYIAKAQKKAELIMSPDSMIIKIDEDEQMLKLSDYKIAARDALHFNCSSFEVTVN